jgi:hypothetical protein
LKSDLFKTDLSAGSDPIYRDVRFPGLFQEVFGTLDRILEDELKDKSRKSLPKWRKHPNRAKKQLAQELVLYSRHQSPYSRPLTEMGSKGQPVLQWWEDIAKLEDNSGQILPVSPEYRMVDLVNRDIQF